MYNNKYLGFNLQIIHIPGSVDYIFYELQDLDHAYYPTENNITAKEVISPNFLDDTSSLSKCALMFSSSCLVGGKED